MNNQQLVNWFNAEPSHSQNRQKDTTEVEELFSVIFSNSAIWSTSTSDEDSEIGPAAHSRCLNFVQTVDNFSPEDFKSHMRLQRSTAEFLISLFSQSDFLPDPGHGRRSRIGCKKTVYMYIWYISNTITFRQLGNLFGVPKSSAWMAVKRVASWLVSIGHEYVKWPQGSAAARTRRLFEEKKRMPGVIGAIDCTHIYIKAPKLNKECYFNRKQSYSLVLQGVVDAEKKFIDITCGEPGSLHDSRVLRRSNIYARVQTDYSTLFRNGSYILGDSAYPSTSWLVPPYKDNGNLSDVQRRFNYIHSATRITVENAFGLLKGRFRRLLKFTEQTDLSAITNLVVSACVLHNICIIKDDVYLYSDTEPDELEEEEDIAENEDEDNTIHITLEKRPILLRLLQDHHII